jgi:hypothetical protein
MVVADPPAPGRHGPAVGAVAAAVGNAAQLLDIDVDQLAGPLALVAHDRAAGPVGVDQPVQTVAAQHPIDGRARHPQVVAEPVGVPGDAGGGRPALDGPERERGHGAAMRPRGPVGQPGLTMLAVAGQPLVGRGPRHPQALGGLGGGQPSSVMRWTSSGRPNSVRRA